VRFFDIESPRRGPELSVNPQKTQICVVDCVRIRTKETEMRSKQLLLILGTLFLLTSACGEASPPPGASPATSAGGSSAMDRTHLPVAEPVPQTYSELDARNTTPPPQFVVKPPQGAPNVVIVLIDDIGFGGPSTFGGPINTPTMDALARTGLSFNNFHTTALCSPTRNALKTGRNHYVVNTGSIMESSTAYPGNTGQNPNSVAPLAEMMRLGHRSGLPAAAGPDPYPNDHSDPHGAGRRNRASASRARR
jgi:arylsulfatase